MEKITFECEVVTPMFLAGADGETSELRTPSIKGAMRFWWRAMNGKLLKEKNENWDYSELKRKEGEIFGDTNQKSSFSIKVNYNESLIKFSNEEFPSVGSHSSYNNPNRGGGRPKSFNVNPLNYLAFGISQYDKSIRRNQLVRNYINVNSKFILTLNIRNFKADVIGSFLALEKYGGLGSKARNGFGCFKIISSSIDISEFGETLELIHFKNDVLNYTCFTNESELVSYKNKITWYESLAEIGRLYQQAREKQEKWHEYNERELIAAPIIVFKKGQVSELDRHAKPFFFHVRKLEDNSYQGECLCLPYNYIIADRRANYKNAINKMKTALNFPL